MSSKTLPRVPGWRGRHEADGPGGAMTQGARRSSHGTFDRRYERVAKWFLAHGVRPNHLTFLQVPVFAVMVWAALEGRPWTFFGFSLFVILLDGGDGILARVGGMQSRAGAILDASMDTLGIAVVLWCAAQFYGFGWALVALFLLNALLYGQNMVLDEKVVSYMRGPVIAPIIVPDSLYFALAIAFITVGWLLLWRVPRTLRILAGRPVPPAP